MDRFSLDKAYFDHCQDIKELLDELTHLIEKINNLDDLKKAVGISSLINQLFNSAYWNIFIEKCR